MVELALKVNTLLRQPLFLAEIYLYCYFFFSPVAVPCEMFCDCIVYHRYKPKIFPQEIQKKEYVLTFKK